MEPSCVDSVFSVISFMAFVTNSLAAPQFGVPGYSAAANMTSLFDLFDPNKVDSEPWNEFAEAYFPYAARPTPKNFTTFLFHLRLHSASHFTFYFTHFYFTFIYVILCLRYFTYFNLFYVFVYETERKT